jgi:hypothetical protein
MHWVIVAAMLPALVLLIVYEWRRSVRLRAMVRESRQERDSITDAQ